MSSVDGARIVEASRRRRVVFVTFLKDNAPVAARTERVQ